jgi:glycosyltransferase involved in cell wall biosynthesis
MNSSPKITIVIPSYNKVDYIEETLRSIFLQKYKNFEVIIQDGGSTDGSDEIIRKYAKKYPTSITWESKKDKGQLDAVNKGMKKASGEIVTFINADDAYEPRAFELVSRSYKKNPGALWFAGKGTVVNKDGHEIAEPVTIYKNFLLTINHYSLLLVVNYFLQPSVFINHNAYKKSGPFTGTNNFIIEYEMWLKLGKTHMPVIINKNLSKFRIEDSTKTKTMFNDLLNEDERILAKYTKNGFIIFLHELHNLGRKIIGRFV